MTKIRMLGLALAWCFFCLTFASVPDARGDGCVFRPVEPSVAGFSANQRAIIFYNSATATETMLVTTQYIAEPADFAWIIPVPELPASDQVEVLTGGGNLLYDLTLGTAPSGRITPPTGGCVSSAPGAFACGGGGSAGGAATGTVEVVDRLKIQNLDISLLRAQASSELTTWLTDNGYKFSGDTTTVLDHYIAKGWAFVAVKFNTDESAYPAGMPIAAYFPFDPLKITFHSNKLVFPMRVSAISASESGSDVLLFIFTAHRVRCDGRPTVKVEMPDRTYGSSYEFQSSYNAAFNQLLDQPDGRALVVEYANWADATGAGAHLQSLFSPGQRLFLTRLRTIFLPEHMTDDLVFVQDQSDEVHVVASSGGSPRPVFIMLAAVCACLLCGVSVRPGVCGSRSITIRHGLWIALLAFLFQM